MMFKKPKEKILQDIWTKAQAAAYSNVYNDYNLQQIISTSLLVNQNAMSSVIANAVGFAVQAALKEMIEQIYTDAEFEEDIGLREKNETQR